MKKNIDYKKDLAEKLEELKKIEGFPIGNDEDILSLSEPPYYTACPNPYIKDFIEEYGTPYDEETDDYQREPFNEDVIEGKNDEFYLAHTYHTKVPPSAIRKYIEHFTEKNDLIGDFFCGSGMTGVAAQLSERNAIIFDLSTIATLISYNFNSKTKINDFLSKSISIIETAEKELSELFKTTHNGKEATINYVVWSEVLISPFSNQEFIYYDVAYDKNKGELLKEFTCPYTGAILTKDKCKKSLINIFDEILNKNIHQQKIVPVIINYSYNGKKYNKRPDNNDLLKIQKVENYRIPYWYPTNIIPKGDKTGEPIRVGYTHIHHLYFKRILWILSKIYSEIKELTIHNQLFSLLSSSINRNLFKGNRFVINKYNPNGRINGPLSGTLYIPPLIVEQNTFEFLRYKIKTLKNMFKPKGNGSVLISTQSIVNVQNIKENTLDYIFTDPPFGSNIMYSELNFIWESWLKFY
ncbi:MAG: site-specific DNA-methyltransferase, partial [Bacteroidales bacterium]|nr:site-specific DNA-methyltransferase [Bacteroidales bacterium]